MNNSGTMLKTTSSEFGHHLTVTWGDERQIKVDSMVGRLDSLLGLSTEYKGAEYKDRGNRIPHILII